MQPTLLITRPLPQSVQFAHDMEAALTASYDVVISPLLRIEPCFVEELPRQIDHVIFTSVNGVAQAARLGVSMSATAWCVGSRTGHAAENAGFEVKVGTGDAEQLLGMVKDAAPLGKIVHIRGKIAYGDIAMRSRAYGLDCIDIVAYSQETLTLSKAVLNLFAGKNPVVIPLFSSRTATILAAQVDGDVPIHIIGMSEAVINAASGLRVATSEIIPKPSGIEMIHATCNRLQQVIDDMH